MEDRRAVVPILREEAMSTQTGYSIGMGNMEEMEKWSQSLGEKKKERKEFGEELFCAWNFLGFFPIWPYYSRYGRYGNWVNFRDAVEAQSAMDSSPPEVVSTVIFPPTVRKSTGSGCRQICDGHYVVNCEIQEI